MDAQNPLVRRAYLIRPRTELSSRLQSLGLSGDVEFLGQQTVVMTARLPYEGKIEGYRERILQECKKAFLKDLIEYEPLSDLSNREALLGIGIEPEEAFDRWWIAEEVEALEIETTW